MKIEFILPRKAGIATLVLLIFAAVHLFATQIDVPSNAEIMTKRLRHAEQELRTLKEEIELSKVRLSQIDQELVGSFDSDTRLIFLENQNKPSNCEVLESKYWLDSRPIELGFDDFISLGSHHIQVQKTVRVKGEVFNLKETHEFVAEKGQTISIETKISKTPSIEFKQSSVPNNMTGRSLLAEQDFKEPAPNLASQESRVIVTIRNKMDVGFRLMGQKLILDSKPLTIIENRLATGEGEVVFEGVVPEGHHRIEAFLTYESKGKSSAAIKNYQYQMKFHHDFNAKKGAIARIEFVGKKT